MDTNLLDLWIARAKITQMVINFFGLLFSLLFHAFLFNCLVALHIFSFCNFRFFLFILLNSKVSRLQRRLLTVLFESLYRSITMVNKLGARIYSILIEDWKAEQHSTF